jgi:hypothetical protein
MPQKQGTAVSDAESPVEEYDKAQNEYRSSANNFRQHLATASDADDTFRSQQHAMFSLLVSADTIWDSLVSSKGSAQRKHAAAMHNVIAAITESLSAQDKSLSLIEAELSALASAMVRYRESIAETRVEHGHVERAVDGRLKSMTKMLRTLGSSAEDKKKEKKERKDSGERKARAASPQAPSAVQSERKKSRQSPVKS